jgi:hypothetical protein
LKIAVIVCGYGKNPTESLIEYMETLLYEIAINFILKGDYCKVIVSGGDTEKNGEWKTEAEMMEKIANGIMVKERLPKNRVSIETENHAYNTFTNILLSKNKFKNEIDEFDKIIVVCNEAHYIKSVFASIKVFGWKTVSRKVIFYTFPLVKRFSENIKTYFKTVFESSGYFFRPLGRRLEHWQWRIRTGRNERLNYWQFRLKCAKSGELF